MSLERLRLIALFAGIDDDVGREVLDALETARVPAGRAVIEQDDPADRLYVVARGTLAVTRRGPDGAPVPLATLSDGDTFGEIALLHDVARTSTVTTTTDTTLLSLSRDRFGKLMRARAEASRAGARHSRRAPREQRLPAGGRRAGDERRPCPAHVVGHVIAVTRGQRRVEVVRRTDPAAAPTRRTRSRRARARAR